MVGPSVRTAVCPMMCPCTVSFAGDDRRGQRSTLSKRSPRVQVPLFGSDSDLARSIYPTMGNPAGRFHISRETSLAGRPAGRTLTLPSTTERRVE